MNSNYILDNLIKNFNIETLKDFFKSKNDSFISTYDDLTEYINIESFKNNFAEIIKIGEMDCGEIDKLIVVSSRVLTNLSERSGKKEQYDLSKKILKSYDNYTGGFFIFYDEKGNFRFSFIFSIPTSKGKQDWSNFRRYTYYVSKELTNKTFLKQVGETDFLTFNNIKEAFSVEPVTRQFYEEISNWYFWAYDKIKFPDDYKYNSKDDKKDEEIRNSTNLIRLITRIIFVWFIKEKGLIPELLFDKEKLKNIVKDFNEKESHNYYNAILQNLFFATLNQKMNDRKFAIEEDFPKNKNEYGIKTFFRYKNKFLINEESVLKIFKDIPFLNGGLFDCLDKEDDESNKVIYIDGFSRNSKKEAIIPDYLFFSDKEKNIDLNKFGLGANKKVRGLIDILKSYNFTIDENTPIDQEVALDPELLGKVFENLLALYNPETSTTARKATGSYYTPREIVDYMVEESLREYLKTKLPYIDENKLEILLSFSEEVPNFSEEEKQKIISAIDEIKILDPACGSGAFPMGILHKLVYILQKIDPDNKQWYELHYQKALKASEEIFKEKNKTEREEMLKEINEAFDESINYPDYARKLYLIENCIYGVDIQPIAIQISKLRFFISLILDQKTDKEKENYGIRPLPNLETKFVSADTLIGLEKPDSIFYTNEIKKLEEEIKKVRHKYFTAKTRKEKSKLKKNDKKLREELRGKLKSIGFSSESSQKIVSFDLFDQNATADWFDPEWMFGVTDGFDIVIGNPPYGNILDKDVNKNTKKFVEKNFKYSTSSDISSPFIEMGFNLLKEKGNLVFIITYAITFNKDFSKSRELLANNFERVLIYIFDRDRCRIFKSMTQSVSILKCFNKNAPVKEGIYTSRMFRETPDINSIEVTNCNGYLLAKNSSYSQSHRLPKIGEKINRQILEKLLQFNHNVGSVIKNNGSKIWIRTSGNYWYNAFDRKPYHGYAISSISVIKEFSNFLILLINSSLFYFWFRIYGDGHNMNLDILESFPLPEKEKILRYNILLDKMKQRFMDKLFSVFDKKHNRFITSNIKSEIDLLDLILCKYFYNLEYEEILHFLNYDFEVRTGNKLPKQFMDIISKIISTQKQNPEADTSQLEKQIDQLVYKLYDLTEEESKLIEGDS